MASSSKLNSPVCLGIPEWCPCCNEPSGKEPSPKKKRLSLQAPKAKATNESCDKENDEPDLAEPSPKKKRLSLKMRPKLTKATKERYDFSMSDDDFDQHRKGYCPKNTQISTDWAVRNFHQWREARNAEMPSDSCPSDILLSDCVVDLDHWLCRYVTETRKADGSEYPPRTLHQLLVGLQRYIRIRKRSDVSLLQGADFRGLQNLCNSLFNELHKKGVGADVKKTQPLTSHDEIKLWEKGVLRVDTPQGLLNCVFFYNGKNFCLRGGQEQRDLKLSQLHREVVNVEGESRVRYTYMEHGSKNRQKGLKQLRLENKVIHQYETPECGDQCHVSILDKYIAHLPPGAFQANAFYFRPLEKINPSKPWYSVQPLGRNTLSSMMKTISKEGGLLGNITNHSLRAYAASEMFQKGVPETLIMQRTGHKSLEALRKYESASDLQVARVSDTLSCVATKVESKQVSVKHQVEAPVSQSASALSAFSLSGCNFQNCTVNFISPSTSSTSKCVRQSDLELDSVELDRFTDF